MRANLLLTSLLLSLLLLGACDGGSGSNNNDGVVPPPVVPPDDTLTGFLVDSAVSGVSYATPTHQGVTGADGSFQYERGETVRFTIGDTLLGEVTGQEQVTPFELAGSAVVTGGPDITAALGDKDDPFQAVVNIATLLQSLDQDGDPDNGIEINPEVAALFADVNLDVSQHWSTFRNQYNLRYALEQANEQSLFTENHEVANPAAAVQHLYQSLEIDAQIFFISQWESKIVGPNFSASRIERWQYNANGYLMGYGSDLYYNEPAGVPDLAVGYEYSNDGNLTRFASPASILESEDSPREFEEYGYKYEYDTRGNLTRIETETRTKNVPNPYANQIVESTTVTTESRQYDSSGSVTQIERHVNTVSIILNGVASEELPPPTNEIWQYDANGNLTRHQTDGDGDGAPDHDEIWERQYDDVGRLTEVKYDANSNPDIDSSCAGDQVVGDGIPMWTAAYQYDVPGRPIRVELNGECLSAAARALNISTIRYLLLAETYLVTYEYGADGNLAKEILDGFSSNYGHEIVTRTYDARGNVTLEEDQIVLLPSAPPVDFRLYSLTEYGYEYNEFGNVIRQTIDEGGDGSVEYVYSWEYEYDSNGNLTHYVSNYETPYDSGISDDYIFQYEPVGWGHLFASPPPFPVLDTFGWGALVWPSASSPLDWNLL